MKNKLLLIGFLLSSFSLWSQENMVTISGGYAWANIEDVETNATGWRLNGLYEFNPNQGKLAHGLSFGYIGTSGSADTTLITGSVKEVEVKINNWPIYYAPKLMFGSEKLKGFVKGAIGFQFSSMNTTTSGIETTVKDAGFYGGLGAGIILNLSEKLFINLEYEWAYASNSFYRDGFINSAMGGIGMRF